MNKEIKTTLRKTLWNLGYKVIAKENLPCGIIIETDISKDVPKEEINVIFDIGANVGQAAFNYSELYPNSKIYSFEPIPHIFDTFKKNIGTRNIHPFKIGFGNEEKQVKVFLQSKSICNSLAPDVNKPDSLMENKSVDVEVRTIDSFCAEHKITRIDLLKIDTEGFDFEVLQGAKGVLDSGIVKYILVETSFNSDIEPRYTSFEKVKDYLGDFGFRVRAFYNQCTNDHPYMAYVDALFLNQK